MADQGGGAAAEPLRSGARLAAVVRSGLLDTPPEEPFDRLAELARELLRTPFAFITVVDEHRSFWKARIGVPTGPGEPTQNTVEESFCQYVISSGTPVILGDARIDPRSADNPSIQSLGIVAWAGYPLQSPDGQVLGSFCVADTVARHWTEADARLLVTLSRVAGTEVALRDAVATAEHALEQARTAQRRIQLLAASGGLLAAGLDLDTVLAAVTRMVVPVLGDAAYVYTLDRQGGVQLRESSVHSADPAWQIGLEHALRRYPPSLDAAAGPGSVLRTGDPHLFVSDPRVVDELPPELAEEIRSLGVAGAVSLPLRARGTVLGELTVLRRRGRDRFGDEDLAVAGAVADRAALALDNATLYGEQRDTALALQQAMLTRPQPSDQLQIAVRYLPAAARAQVGGDWYDSFRAGDGATVLAIGDVVGHDLHAAAAMGQLRTMLRVLAYQPGRSPAQILSQVDETLAGLDSGLDSGLMATAVLARVDPGGGDRTYVLHWSNAGHPPPLLLARGGTAVFLPGDPELLLGVRTDTERTLHSLSLPPGVTVLLYTDGLVERRDRPLDAGLTALAGLLDELGELPLEQCCDELLARALPQLPEDDVALLALRTPA